MSVEQTISELEHELYSAQQRRDREALEAIVGDDFTMTAGVPGREVRTREDWLDIAIERYEITSFSFDELVLQHYGDCVVARSRFVQEATLDGAERDGAYRITDVWIRSGDRWQVQARHSQPLPD